MGLPPIHGNRAAQCAAPTVLHGYIRNTGRAGEGTRPYGESGSVSFFFVGAGHWPARRGRSAIPEPTLIRLASLGTFPLEGGRLCRRGKSLSPLFRCARYLPLIRGVVPSPTGFRWVGEALGPPADPWKPGGPVCRPYGFTRVHSKHWAGG